MKHYKAPWSTSLLVVSALATIVCLAVTFGFRPRISLAPLRHCVEWLRLLPLALVVGCALFTIRGYTVATGAILVHRLLWSTRLPLTGLQTAHFDPGAMVGSIRTFGNGGFYSFTGRYWNKHLGSYRAYVTDPKRAVVLRFRDHTVVLSPDAPEDFVRDLTPHTTMG